MYRASASRLEPEAVTSLPADGEETARAHLANFFAERYPEEQIAVGEAVPQYVYPDEMGLLDSIGAPDDVVPPTMMDAPSLPSPTGGGNGGEDDDRWLRSGSDGEPVRGHRGSGRRERLHEFSPTDGFPCLPKGSALVVVLYSRVLGTGRCTGLG